MADFDLSEILNSLSSEDIENIKNLASEFLGEKNSAQTEQRPKNNIPDASALQGLGLPDLSQLTSILPVLQEMGKPDSRLDFINALKPLLSQSRQQRADEALKLVRLMSLLPLLRERGLM